LPQRKRVTKDRKLCFRIESKVYEVLRIIADYHDMTVSDVLRLLAYDLAVSFYLGIPRRIMLQDVEPLIRRVLEESEEGEGGG